MYADFSGYSDMSIGVAKLLGIRIAINFNYPFFAVNIAEYWRRWHISLTSWLTDYVFSPLSIRFRDWGNRGLIVSILITFVLIGAWHGARWTFVVFGLYHGLLYIPLMLNGSFFKKSKLKSQGRWNLPAGKDFRQMTGTFLLVALGLILFRAESLNDFAHMLLRVLDVRLSALQQFPSLQLISALIPAFPAVCFMFWIEWRKRQKEFALQLQDSVAWKRRLLYAALVVCIFVFRGEAGEFIYFQF
jgi:D-alanyl-lipoteichoic acid acyltransferase DltB (MBOAT superfamily)